ncbi:putative protein kinase TKL-Pl-4 family [Helianthus debilis subsp. tardiflorus]
MHFFNCVCVCVCVCIYICMQNVRPPLPDSCPIAFRQLIRRCWSIKTEKRPRFDEIVRILERYETCGRKSRFLDNN